MEEGLTQMTKYRLKYVEGARGRAEMMVLMFRLAKVDYEDIRLPRLDTEVNWTEIKQTLPLGQIPVFEEDGHTEDVAQTVPIAMYLAEKLGFLPENRWKSFLTNSIVTTLNDLITEFAKKRYIYTIYKILPSPGEERLSQATEECVAAANQALDYIEKLADKKARFIFSDQIELADICMYTVLEYCCVEKPQLRQHSEWLKHWLKSFESDSRIVEYLQTRPSSTYGT